MTRNPKTAVSLALLPPPEDVRVLRLVPALAYLNIVDASGGEPLYSYRMREIAHALDWLRRADSLRDSGKSVEAAIAAAAVRNGDRPNGNVLHLNPRARRPKP
jgi:hypothetical protein